MSHDLSDERPSGADLDRRAVLKLGAAGAALAGVARAGEAAAAPAAKSAKPTTPEGEERLRGGHGRFRVEIDGVALTDVESVAMDELAVDVRELTTGADWDYRVYGPGDAHYGSITIRARVGKDSRELYQWWLDCSQGKNIRKQISVICLKRDGSDARRWNVVDAFPTTWDPGDYSPSSNVACETIVCKMGRVELG